MVLVLEAAPRHRDGQHAVEGGGPQDRPALSVTVAASLPVSVSTYCLSSGLAWMVLAPLRGGDREARDRARW